MQYEITHACGHDQTRQIYGTNTRGQREQRAEWLATRPCTNCARAAHEHERDAVQADAGYRADAEGWPPLAGPDRHAAQAEVVRVAAADKITERLGEDHPARQDMHDLLRQGLLCRHTDAHWRLDHQDLPLGALIKSSLTESEKETLRALSTARPPGT